MIGLSEALKKGTVSTWLGTAVLGYAGVLIVLAAGVGFLSRALGLPDYIARIVFLVGLIGLPVAAVYGVLKARAIRRTRVSALSDLEAVPSQIQLLVEERDFYRDLVEGRDRVDARDID